MIRTTPCINTDATLRKEIITDMTSICNKLGSIQNLSTKINTLNKIRRLVHSKSPFKNEPVDNVTWVLTEKVKANDYNPNKVAPPEMKLLELSILQDGFTQPIVTWATPNSQEVIDGFHRIRVGKESDPIKERLSGYVPTVAIQEDRKGRNDRISATIRHNRARGKHVTASMSDIVVELKKRNWTTFRICKELGMDEDEVLRLCQITGLSEVFSDTDFSHAWDVSIYEESDLDLITEDDIDAGPAKEGKEERIQHTWDKWECYRSGFYENHPPDGMTKEKCEETYKELLSDPEAFAKCLQKIIKEWKYSCEHYLTNPNMNRIAWLGQAALAYKYKIPSIFRGGYNLLTDEQKQNADDVALDYLNKWRNGRGLPALMPEQAQSKTEPNLY